MPLELHWLPFFLRSPEEHRTTTKNGIRFKAPQIIYFLSLISCSKSVQSSLGTFLANIEIIKPVNIRTTNNGEIPNPIEAYLPSPTHVAGTTAVLFTVYVVLEFIRAVTIAETRSRTSSRGFWALGKRRVAVSSYKHCCTFPRPGRTTHCDLLAAKKSACWPMRLLQSNLY